MKFIISIALISLSFLVHSQSGFTEFTDSLGLFGANGSNGVAVSDYDKDGDLDFYISARSSPNIFFQNQGDSIFVDVAPLLDMNSFAFSKVATWADFDNDGWDDLYLANMGSNHNIFKNLGDGTFEDLTDSTLIESEYNTNSLNVVDLNNDGFLDIYLSNVSQPNELYMNQGNFTFTEESEAYGLLDQNVAMGTIFWDYDLDGDLDAYLTHDADQAAIFYENNGDGTFTNIASQIGLAVERNGMGVDLGDYDLDGDLDIYLSNLYPNDLLRKEDDGTYTNVTEEAGAGDSSMGWGMFFFDYDNDADKDIFISNMSYMGNRPNILYRNDGNGQFTNVIEEGEAFESYQGGYGAAYLDFNRDGYLDIVLANTAINDVNQIFINENSGNNWVVFKLEGTVSNKNAINSRISVYTDSLVQLDVLLGASGYCSQNMMGEHFGLGQRTLIDSVKIEWPSGIVEVYDSLDVNQNYVLIENQGLELLEEYYTAEEEEEEPVDPIVLDLFEIVSVNPGSGFSGPDAQVLTQLEEEEEEEEEEEKPNAIEEFDSETMVAYPNPSPKIVNWQIPFEGDFTFKIYTSSGQLVYERGYTACDEINVDINAIDLAHSQYVYEFTSSKSVYSGRFFVLR